MSNHLQDELSKRGVGPGTGPWIEAGQAQPINLTRIWSTPDDLIRDDLHRLRIHFDGRLLRLSESEIDDIIAIIDKHKAQISHDVDKDEIITTPRMPKSRRYTTKD